MADNLSPTFGSWFPLRDHAVVALDGADSSAFAHAQFANDVAALPVGQWQWNAWLTPKGRTIALFALLKPGEDEIRLLLPDHPADTFAEQLRRFVFRRKVRIQARTDLTVQGSFRVPAQARGALLARLDEAIELDFGAADGARSLRIAATAAATNDADAAARWFAFDLRHGLPRLAASQREQWTPQQLSLERLRAFSVKKGCYPGQEIVARTHFLGKAKRGLALLSADTPLPGNADIESDAGSIGKVVSATGTAPWLALAVLPLERAPGPLACAGAPLHELPLLDGLQR